ncbi:FAD:protein FMN transferase [Ruegeria arenilitoris]|uniref:FAD:protein FMN transferase n=1 Tax=Ruegeria arenilitoris TaxID=1173585 RepID=UPI00147BFD64|nr:FAD:protein FMN transferase [Ruegeria arenilitoris]
MSVLTRRRFLTISAACAAMPTTTVAVAQWRGIALGAPASLRLEGLTNTEAAPIFAAVEAELDRLEAIFSLYRTESELSRLNASGRLKHPSPELLGLLSLCAVLHDVSEGAFDPTIQPLWNALAKGAGELELQAAQDAVGWQKVSVASDEIRLHSSGIAALTLNGIAQGEVTDRIVDLLRSIGLQSVLVNMGEIAGLGWQNDGADWQVGLAGPNDVVLSSIELQNRAVATSVPGAMRMAEMSGHIFDPRSLVAFHEAVSISAPTAALADGLSTTLCVTPTERINAIMSRFPDAKLEMLV